MMYWLLGIRTKLFGVVLLAFVVLIGGTYWQIGEKAQAVSQTVIDRSLTQSSAILDTRIDSRFKFIKEIANAIARDGRVLPLVFDEASATLQDQSLEFQAAYEFDILFFLNGEGTILARSDQPDAIGVNLAGKSSLFDDALKGKETRGFIVSDGKLMQMVVAPVFDNVVEDLVRGAVVVAYELSKATANEIVVLTESEIGFFVFTRDDRGIINGVDKSFMTDDQLAESMLAYFAQEPSSWYDIVEKEQPDFRKSFTVSGQLQHSVLHPISSRDGTRLGFVAAMRSSAELTQPFEEIKQSLLVIGLVCLVVALLLAVGMALGLSRPILRLVGITKQIQEGNHPKFKLKKNPRDEIGVLENALLKMGNNLREKAELESFLADIANEVDVDMTTLPKEAVAEGLEPENQEDDEEKTVVVHHAQQAPAETYQPQKEKKKVVDGRYKILEPLGSGGIGSVYLAYDMELEEKIAIKLMRSDVIESVNGLNFKEEIRLARKITHRNIVRTFDFGAWQKAYYITMEFVQGIGLSKFISKQTALDTTIGVGICKQICSAVMAAHQMGIIHRDLKPANMIINRRGILQIMDFGLAMKVDKSGNERAENAVMGTPKYMAPEQFLGSNNLDERTDIYSIGVVMFTLFNGKPPYSGKDLETLSEQHRNAPIPAFSEDSSVPPQLYNIICKAMAKEPGERFQSVRELLAQLNRLELN